MGSLPASSISSSISSSIKPVDVQEPVTVTVLLEAGALNRYAALVFGLPLLALFALAALTTSVQITSPTQLLMILLVVAMVLLIVTAVCRSVARRFESPLQLEIRH